MLLKRICKELGVEVGEIWKGSDGFKYCILSDGNIERYEGEILENYMTLNVVWKDIISGKLKPIWKPKEGELYYVPSIRKWEDYRCHVSTWLNDDIDNWYMANNMIFKTKEEAIDCATNMIDLAKHGI